MFLSCGPLSRSPWGSLMVILQQSRKMILGGIEQTCLEVLGSLLSSTAGRANVWRDVTRMRVTGTTTLLIIMEADASVCTRQQHKRQIKGWENMFLVISGRKQERCCNDGVLVWIIWDVMKWNLETQVCTILEDGSDSLKLDDTLILYSSLLFFSSVIFNCAAQGFFSGIHFISRRLGLEGH